MTKKSEKLDLSEEDNDFNLLSLEKLLKISSEIVDIRKDIANILDQINLVHKSVANLRPDVRQVVRGELTVALNGGIQGY